MLMVLILILTQTGLGRCDGFHNVFYVHIFREVWGLGRLSIESTRIRRLLIVFCVGLPRVLLKEKLSANRSFGSHFSRLRLILYVN